ncbi:MAG: flagellar motor switch protein FliM [Pseudomonadales bacterium]
MSEDKENSNELLSKEEIDTLLTGVDDGNVETERSVLDGEAKSFDFAEQDKIVRGRMPTLEMLNERFARFFRSSLSDMLQRNCDVQPLKLEVQKYSEYASSLYVPASLNWIEFAPLYGRGLLTLDATLVFKLVDLFFGGSGKTSKIENREFTLTEQRIISRVISASFLDIKQAWQSVVEFQPVTKGHECNPLLTNVLSPSESVIVSRFEVDLDGDSGEFHIVMPLSMVEPIKDTLGAGIKTDVDMTDDHWSEVLQRELMYADVDISCKVAERKISLRDILDLQEGDVIPIDLPDQVSILAGNRLLYSGKFGVSGDRLAVQIKEKLTDQAG